MNFILSLLPILLILFLMVGLRWGAARAGAAGYLTALVIAMLFFGTGPELLAYAHARGLLLSLDVLFIIWAAFLLYRVADEAGAIRTIGQALPHLTPDRGMQALLIGWGFASFLQGVGGFGVPVAVVSPILVGLGFAPLAAVVIPSIGHGWAVTFGSLGSSFQALMSATGQPQNALAGPAAIFLGCACLMTGFLIAHANGGWSDVRRLALPCLALGGTMGVIQYIVVTNGFWNIGAFSGAIAGLMVAMLLLYPGLRRNHNAGKSLDRRALLIALSGYALLVLVILGAQLIPPVKSFLNQVVIQVKFPEVSTSQGYVTPAGVGRKISLFGHTGSLLLYAAGLAYLAYWRAGLYKPGAPKRIVDGTLRRVMSSSVSIVSMIAMAVIMEMAGMTETLAKGLAQGTGRFFPLVAPWIGAIGAFMTGSNTNSNVVFGMLQLRTAELLGYSIAIILAAQTAGAALASVMSPAKVVVGASTAGMAGKEGEVMRQLVVYAGLLVLLVSLLALAGVWLW